MSGRARHLALLAALLLPTLVACEARPEAAQAPPAADVEVAWKTLGTWSGQGSRQTESFEFTSGSLRMIWEAREEAGSGPGHFQVALHSSISGRALQVVADVRGGGADTVLFSAEPHVAYLRIDSEAVPWRIQLDEGVPGESDP